jgi:hypothetical protein
MTEKERIKKFNQEVSDLKENLQYGCLMCEKQIVVYKEDLCYNCYGWYEGVKPYCT